MREKIRKLLSVPNLLSLSRLIFAPVLLGLAWKGEKELFLILLTISLLTDAVDGTIARHWKLTSAVGTRLDSWGDFANYLAMPLCVWWLWPDVIRREKIMVSIALGSFVLPTLIGTLKFHRMTSYHTWSAKVSAVLISFALLFLLTGLSPWPFRLSVPILVLAAIDDTAITFILSRWQSNVPSLYHAVLIERARRAGTQPASGVKARSSP